MSAGADRDRNEARALRVLHVFRYFQPDFTGEGLYFEKLAACLADCGIRSDVAVAARTVAPDLPTPPGIDAVHRLVDGSRLRPWGNGPLLAWLARHARRYDVVHFHSFVDRLFLPQLIARMSGCRVVQSATLDDGLGMVVDSYRPRGRWFVRRLCRLIDQAVAISPRLFEDSIRILPWSRVSLIPQGVRWQNMRADPQQRLAARKSLGFAPEDIVLLFVGGICARKDVAFLLDAMPAARRNHAAIRLLVVGPELEPDYAAALRQRAASFGDGTVLFTGLLEDPTPAYFAADVFVFASREEGFGNVLIEAMAAGLPVLARRLPDVTDSFIADGETGLLFSDVGGYEGTLDRLVTDSSLRQRIGRAARAAAARYDMAAVATRYAALYRGEVAATPITADPVRPQRTPEVSRAVGDQSGG